MAAIRSSTVFRASEILSIGFELIPDFFFNRLTLIWLTVVKRKKASRPTVFQWSLSWIDSKALKEAEPMLRRLITLIFAGWLPHDYVSSWSCLYLSS